MPGVEADAAGGAAAEEFVVVGQVNGAFGTRGWVKVHSHTRPRDNLLGYRPWFLRTAAGWQAWTVAAARAQGNGLIAQLEGIADRDQAAALVRSPIAVRRSQLAPLPPGEFYWADLIGLRVVNVAGVELGRVRALFETGAHDVLEVIDDGTARLIPYVPGRYVIEVRAADGVVIVDWHADD